MPRSQEIWLRKGRKLRIFVVMDCFSAVPGNYNVTLDHEPISGIRIPSRNRVEVTRETAKPEVLSCIVEISRSIMQSKLAKMGILTIFKSGEYDPILRANLPPVFLSDTVADCATAVGIYVSVDAGRAYVSSFKAYKS